jgi:hypothetical protein
MNTFLPYDDFARSARCLDRMRLGKMRVETLQLLKSLIDPTYGWRNHPASRMWSNHGRSLARYGVAVCDVWIARGYKDTCRDKILELNALFPPDDSDPEWLGNEQFHASHRSNLLRKSPEFYSQYGWTESPDLEYIWPVK